MNGTVIGIDIGGTNLRIGCVDPKGNISNYYKCSSRVLVETDNSIRTTGEVIANYIKDNGIGDVAAVSIGFPAAVSKDRQTPLSVPNLQNGENGFDGKNVVKPLTKYLDIPVFINKDANNLLQCDITLRKIGSKDIVVGIYFGTGIGNSVYICGDFLAGKHGTATALGHIPFFKSDRVCNCGNVGCSECYASGFYLEKLWQQNFSNVPLPELFLRYGDAPEIVDFVEACAITAATEINLFDPDLVIIGGGVAEMKGFPMALLRERTVDHCRKPYPSQGVVFDDPIIKQNAGVIGAAFYAYDLLKKGGNPQ